MPPTGTPTQHADRDAGAADGDAHPHTDGDAGAADRDADTRRRRRSPTPPVPPTATPICRRDATRTPTATPVPPTATRTRTPTRTPTPLPGAPVVSSIDPASGPTTPGTDVTILGANFQPGAAVRIGGVPPTSVTIVSSTKITVKTPLLAAGTLNDVAVMNPGSPIGTLPDGFLADFWTSRDQTSSTATSRRYFGMASPRAAEQDCSAPARS